MKPTTLCFPVDPAGRLLLGCKKRGFGAGKWNGFGGKLEGKETFRACAVREVREEAGIRINPDDLDLIGFKGQVIFDDDGETVKHMELFNL